ncbi:hypothetical protein, partial [Bacillus velezensis]|uniref:hypothetical protein n=1 Tax=Bacillus velezensis TaxID=492670 RepID=UPI001C92D1C0
MVCLKEEGGRGNGMDGWGGDIIKMGGFDFDTGEEALRVTGVNDGEKLGFGRGGVRVYDLGILFRVNNVGGVRVGRL